jgi:protein SPA2
VSIENPPGFGTMKFTKLLGVSATSQLFLQAPKQMDDQLPVSPDGGILDIHMTAFLSAIDSLLTAGRSNAPTKVLTPMKAVVNAVTAITDDVEAFERRMPPTTPRDGVDVDTVRSLRERADATLSNLVTASKTHATSAGMSPVSLLDAAASHVSAAVTELGKIVRVKKASKVEQDMFFRSTNSPASPPAVTSPGTNGYSPSLRSVDEVPASHVRKASAASSTRRTAEAPSSSSPLISLGRIPPMAPTQTQLPTNSSSRSLSDPRRRPVSDQSSSGASSPPPIFDKPPAVPSDDSAQGDPEDAWSELKVGYIL